MMKRRLLAILSLILVAVMVFSLPSCGKKKTTDDSKESETQASDIVGNGNNDENNGAVNPPSDDELVNDDSENNGNQDNGNLDDNDDDNEDDNTDDKEEEFTVTEVEPVRNGNKVAFGSDGYMELFFSYRSFVFCYERFRKSIMHLHSHSSHQHRRAI